MLIPKKNRVQIYSYLFKEGVMVGKNDMFVKKHMSIDLPNLHVLQCLKSLKSRGYVTQQYNWGYFYWYLTNEGIEYLRGFLHLPDDIVPSTLKKPRSAAPRAGGPPGDRFGRDGGDRPPRRFDGPRGGAEGGAKKLGPGEDYQPSFNRGEGRGFGRGRQEGGGFGGGDRRPGGFGGQREGGYRRAEGAAPGGAPAPGAGGFGRGAPRS